MGPESRGISRERENPAESTLYEAHISRCTIVHASRYPGESTRREPATSPPTIRTLVDRVKAAAAETGIDVSPSDVGFIVSCFLEGLTGTGSAAADAWLQKVADEAASVRDG